MADRYTNDPTRNVGAKTTHDPTATQSGGGTAYERTFADSYSFAEGIVLGAELTEADMFSLVDETPGKDVGMAQADTYTLADALIEGFGMNPADSFSLAENSVLGIELNETDAFSLADAITNAMGLNPADAYSLAEAVAKEVGLNPVDSFILEDAITKAVNLSISDSYSLADDSILNYQKFSLHVKRGILALRRRRR